MPIDSQVNTDSRFVYKYLNTPIDIKLVRCNLVTSERAVLV